MNNQNNNCSFQSNKMNSQEKTKKLNEVGKEVKQLFEKARKISAPVGVWFGSKK